MSKADKKPTYKTTGHHYESYHGVEDLFLDNWGDDLWETDKIILVEINENGGDFEDFISIKFDTDRAQSIFDNFTYEIIDTIDYGDWLALEDMVGKNEKNKLCKEYFDDDIYKDDTGAVLLYYKGNFVVFIGD